MFWGPLPNETTWAHDLSTSEPPPLLHKHSLSERRHVPRVSVGGGTWIQLRGCGSMRFSRTSSPSLGPAIERANRLAATAMPALACEKKSADRLHGGIERHLIELPFFLIVF